MWVDIQDPFMASLWIRSGELLAIKGTEHVSRDISSGAYFEALNEGFLIASLKTIERVFFALRIPLLDCLVDVTEILNLKCSFFGRERRPGLPRRQRKAKVLQQKSCLPLRRQFQQTTTRCPLSTRRNRPQVWSLSSFKVRTYFDE